MTLSFHIKYLRPYVSVLVYTASCAVQYFPQLVGKTFREAAFYFPDAIVLGLVNQNRWAGMAPMQNSQSDFQSQHPFRQSVCDTIAACLLVVCNHQHHLDVASRERHRKTQILCSM